MKKYTFRNYIEYLKDNPKEYWFKRRLYGWGWVPVKLQGWIVILTFIVFVLLNGIYFGYNTSPNAPLTLDWIWFFGNLIAALIILMFICYKTGEKPKWSWGR